MTEPAKQRFSELLRAATGDLVSFITMLTGDRNLADDLFQDTCLEVWRSRERFRVGEDFGRWARGVARNVVLQHWKRRGRELALPMSPELTEKLAIEWNSGGPLETDSRQEALATCLKSLESGHRELLDRRFKDRWSYRRIGGATERSESAVKMLFSRIRKKLRGCVESRMLREQRHG